MTVIDETIPSKIKKYEYLVYVEFLEMICRIALVGITIQDLVEYKVHMLLELIYNKQYALKYLDSIDNPLKPVDELFKHHKV